MVTVPPPINAMTASTRPQCPVCVSRHRGLCQGVDDQDVEGSVALDASRSRSRVYDAGEAIYVQGDPSAHVFRLISGWVALHRDIDDGRRQIVQFLLPGAMFGTAPGDRDLAHGATAITNASVCPIMTAKLDDLRRLVPSLNERFIQMIEQDNHRLFEKHAAMGQGSAKERIGGLLEDVAISAGGQTSIQPGAAFRMPLTQRHIAEATGLTPIHVNRVLRNLREDRIVDLREGILTVMNPERLHALAGMGDLRPTAPPHYAAPFHASAQAPPSGVGRSETGWPIRNRASLAVDG
jgi:CRP/FNR family transcriptional regulator, anaerobic regulatory protein